jgi:hypothetical protein
VHVLILNVVVRSGPPLGAGRFPKQIINSNFNVQRNNLFGSPWRSCQTWGAAATRTTVETLSQRRAIRSDLRKSLEYWRAAFEEWTFLKAGCRMRPSLGYHSPECLDLSSVDTALICGASRTRFGAGLLQKPLSRWRLRRPQKGTYRRACCRRQIGMHATSQLGFDGRQVHGCGHASHALRY